MKLRQRSLASVLCGVLLSSLLTIQAQSGRQETAIWLRDSPKVIHLTYHFSGISDYGSTARGNIEETARCNAAQTSTYSDVGRTYVWLHTGMLSTMQKLAQTYGYSYLVSELAGGDHSSGSYHYRGTAFDVGTINGRGVSYSNPYYRTFMQRCRDNGGIEVLGPGYPGHDTHVHAAWPSGTSASSPGGCTDNVRKPTNLRANPVGQHRIELKWTDNANNENHFEIQKSRTSGNGPWNTEKTVDANTEQCNVDDLNPGTKYWFRVRAYNGEDKSEWCNPDNATTIDSPPGAPDNLVAVAANDDRINLTWADHANNEDGFKIFRSNDGENFSKIAEIGNNRESYSDIGLRGNRKYWYKVCSYNTWGNSDFSNKANDTTGPTAPSNLSAVKGNTWSSAKLSWTDNAGAEVGFKIERANSDSGPWTQIATNSASDTTYTDNGLNATTTYYYRVRAYNGNANSMYSNVDSMTTGNAPPVLSTIGNKTIAAGQTLAFTATATDPNQSVNVINVTGFQGFTAPSADDSVMFRSPKHSATTSAFIDTSVTNYSKVVDNGPAGNGSTKVIKAQWSFKTGTQNYWVRLTTANAPNIPNPVIEAGQSLRFKIYASKQIKLAIGVRETTNNPAVGENGGTVGDVEWVGVTNVIGSTPMPNRVIAPDTWTTVTFNCQKNPAWSFQNGDGVVKTAKGVLEHLAIVGDGGTGQYNIYLDDFEVVFNNTLDFTLDTGAPAGASIGWKSGDFKWTPTTAQVGNNKLTVRVTDQLGAEDAQTITVTVTGTGNSQPTLAAIGNKTVKEGNALTFTASATDPDAGQTKTFSLDSGAPAGASINASTGAFTWTPSESQGGATYPITVRVTDNGSPAASDYETISVTVNEGNEAPVIAAVAQQYAPENQVFTFTPSVTDSDLPVQSLTYSLLLGPPGMTINANTGTITWTPGEVDAPDTNQVIIRATDNGSPVRFSEVTFNLVATEVNLAPTLTLGTTVSTAIPVTDFESLPYGSFNGTVMFRQPTYSSSTSMFLDATPNTTTVVDTFPEGVAGNRVLNATFSFKTGTTNPWVRLTTFNTSGAYALPNPTIDLTRKIRFDIWTDKSLKVGLGLRETGTSAAIGADGGTTGAIEWVGVTLNGSSPNPSRVASATNWTTMEFDLPNEVIAAFTGDGQLSSATGKGVLEHIVLVPNGGMGAYNVYLDNFQVVTSGTNMVVETGKTIILNNTATDPDRPKQILTFTLDPGAPTNAVIDSKSGAFEWTPSPEQSPSTNVIAIRVTDDGIPALSDVKSVTIVVNRVNTAPHLVPCLSEFFVAPGETVEYEALANDYDLPGDTLTYSLVGSVPSGASIDPVTGLFTWTAPAFYGTNYATIRVTDNGQPALFDELTLVIIVCAPNAAPVLTLSSASVSESVATFETFTNNTPNGIVMFKAPSFSSTTTNYLGTATNYTKVTNSIPTGNTNAGSKVLTAQWSFKTGTSNYWVRLVTTGTTFLPNPTIDLTAKVRFEIYTTKALKVGLGIRETGTTAEIGADGGTVGAIEWVGVPSKNGTSPNPSRLVNSNTWTTLEFNLPVEACTNFSGGNSVLATGKGVLEHLALVGAGGTGTYTVYLNNFQVVTTTPMPGTVTMKSGSTLTFSCSATDADIPAQALTYGLEAGSPVEATLSGTGAFSWTPGATYNGTTNDVLVFVEDAPAGGLLVKRDYKTCTVIVNADSFGAQSAPASGVVGNNETVSLQWNALPGRKYQVQYREGTQCEWTAIGELVTAFGPIESIFLENQAGEKTYRIVEIAAPVADE